LFSRENGISLIDEEVVLSARCVGSGDLLAIYPGSYGSAVDGSDSVQ
jgi:hypothetical protein